MAAHRQGGEMKGVIIGFEKVNWIPIDLSNLFLITPFMYLPPCQTLLALCVLPAMEP